MTAQESGTLGFVIGAVMAAIGTIFFFIEDEHRLRLENAQQKATIEDQQRYITELQLPSVGEFTEADLNARMPYGWRAVPWTPNHAGQKPTPKPRPERFKVHRL